MNLGFDESHFRTEQWTYKVEMTSQRNGMSWWSWRLLSEFQALFLFGKKSYSIDWNFFLIETCTDETVQHLVNVQEKLAWKQFSHILVFDFKFVSISPLWAYFWRTRDSPINFYCCPYLQVIWNLTITAHTVTLSREQSP